MKPMSEKDYQAESDCHTLARAEEIKSDKARHGRAKAHAAKQAVAHAKVAGAKVSGLMAGHRKVG